MRKYFAVCLKPEGEREGEGEREREREEKVGGSVRHYI
jgi:hypothetical protein